MDVEFELCAARAAFMLRAYTSEERQAEDKADYDAEVRDGVNRSVGGTIWLCRAFVAVPLLHR
jgi:hypothetical protein